MDLLKKWFPNDYRIRDLIDELYQRYPKGFYVNAEKKMKDAKGAAKSVILSLIYVCFSKAKGK